VVSEGDLVAAHLTLTGTHLGEWGGRSATGNRNDHMFLSGLAGGVVVELWEVPDTLALREQLESLSPH
jgi:predicted ester cyclase